MSGAPLTSASAHRTELEDVLLKGIRTIDVRTMLYDGSYNYKLAWLRRGELLSVIKTLKATAVYKEYPGRKFSTSGSKDSLVMQVREFIDHVIGPLSSATPTQQPQPQPNSVKNGDKRKYITPGTALAAAAPSSANQHLPAHAHATKGFGAYSMSGMHDDDENDDEEDGDELLNDGRHMMTTIPNHRHPEVAAEFGMRGYLIFQELLASSFPANKAIAGMRAQAAVNSNYTFDDVMIALISELDGLAGEAAAPPSEEVFNADLDRAIRESEGEREAIQQRKRRRVNQLESDCSYSLREALSSDFQSSVMLNIKDKRNVLVSCIELLDKRSCKAGQQGYQVGGDRSSSATHCLCGESLVNLRKNVAKLLIEENNSIKWWKEASFAYLICMSERIDEIGRRIGFGSFEDSLISKVDEIAEAIKTELVALQTVLYATSGDFSAPKAFIDAGIKTGLVYLANKYNMEDDGFEIVTSNTSTNSD